MKQFESFDLDTLNECLWKNGVQISLPPKPFAVLRYLVEHPGRLITHDELLDALWPETYVQPQVLRTYMLDLRKVLGDDAGQPRFIQTQAKRGYRFVAPVVDSADLAMTDQPTVGRSGIEPATARGRAAQETNETNGASTGTSGEPQIVDREEELARLRILAEQLAAGQRQVVFVTGEAGIGKTALVDAFCEHVRLRLPVEVGHGQCVEGFGRKEEYYPVMEALSQICASADGERACRVLARMAPAWLAALGRESTSAFQPATQERMPGDLCAALEELAVEKPLILVFEDLHWADDSTLHLISALARRRAQVRLMVLTTYRTYGVTAEHPLKRLKQDLLMRRLGMELSLAPLGKAAVSQLIGRELQLEILPPGLATFVHRRSEGNPLFVIAILEHLIAERHLVREKNSSDAHWKLHVELDEMEAEVPDRLAQMIEVEMERLSEDEQRMLEAGSLMSVAFPAWAVAAALEKDSAETEEACDGLARRLYFVRRAGQDELPDGTCSAFYVFAHELYREVLYQRQAVARRARRHIRIAERMRELFAGREAVVAREMAMHYEAAGNWRSAVSALRSAAGHAMERLANAEAAELLDRTLRLAQNLSEPERGTAVREIRSELIAAREVLADGTGRWQEMPSKA